MKSWQEFESKQSSTLAGADFICAADGLGLILVSGEDASEFRLPAVNNQIHGITATRATV
jgi:hypothetical protein